ncbi:hypothetical protein PRIPAC_84528 [Pristionchus pacificus]|uniref:Uncharacterized protein n=1 Tax=Pristionchus pacificus TaxID=54126 RepID=A0A2A6BKB4_PRIPA|nr:hypothetical protein PRIPAC_84528 [Pristionchus pacificus]|eukprot:PDM66355.1 hypothetical protein PRIPAC_47772 [Pristionchus pacificus]
MVLQLLQLILALFLLPLARCGDIYREHTKHDTTNENNNKNIAESDNVNSLLFSIGGVPGHLVLLLVAIMLIPLIYVFIKRKPKARR